MKIFVKCLEFNNFKINICFFLVFGNGFWLEILVRNEYLEISRFFINVIVVVYCFFNMRLEYFRRGIGMVKLFLGIKYIIFREESCGFGGR